jgi:hypothetical protein
MFGVACWKSKVCVASHEGMTSTRLYWLISPTLPIRKYSKLIAYGGISARNRDTIA